jgi:hypothetical protein
MPSSFIVRRFLLLGSLSLLSFTGFTTQSSSQSVTATQSSSQPITSTNIASLHSTNSESATVEVASKQSQSQPTKIADSNSLDRRGDTQVDNRESAVFRFFVEREMQNDPRVVRFSGHPCGYVATTRVNIMPNVGNKDFTPDKVVEIPRPSRDLRSLAGSKTLRRWAKPIDSEVIAIAGDRILVNVGQGRTYWIEPSGKFQRQTTPLSVPKPELDETDLGRHPEFIKSDYAKLWRFKDLNSGQERVIIYEVNCS